jgi:signal transduction histidine kinase
LVCTTVINCISVFARKKLSPLFFGMGLFIAMEIIHRYNGETGVTSELGRGSVFYFSNTRHLK